MRALRAILLAVFTATLVGARPAAAQRVSFPSSSQEIRPAPMLRLSSRDSAAIQETYWLRGALMLGAAMGVLGSMAGSSLCENSDISNKHCFGPAVGGFALGGALGFTVGALIGGQFPKRR